MIDGTQAEFVRTPYADNSLILLPDSVNEEVALLLSDALPTAHEIGVQYGDGRIRGRFLTAENPKAACTTAN